MWVKLWRKRYEEIKAGKPNLYLAIYSQIWDFSVFELYSSQRLAANSQRFEVTEEDYFTCENAALTFYGVFGQGNGWTRVIRLRKAEGA